MSTVPFPGQGPGEIVFADPTFGQHCFPCPREERVGGASLRGSGVGGVERPGGLRARLGGGRKFAAGAATLSPQAWPPTVPGAGQGGQHFPSQPGVSSLAWRAVVWTGFPGNPSHVVLSGKSLALGHPQPVPHVPGQSRGPLLGLPRPALADFTSACAPSTVHSVPSARERSHFAATRLEAGGTRYRCQGPGAVPPLA